MADTETTTRRPLMTPSDEANPEQLQLAREQGKALERALLHMARKEAHDGGEQRAGDYLVAYAIEKAEGLWHMEDGELHWREPTDENAHVEIAVCDGADGRFIPGLTVTAAMIDPDGREVGTHELPFLWHPWIFHYGRNWTLPADGNYQLRVRIEPPTFARHDHENGRRYAEPVELTFETVKVERGQKRR